MKKEDIIRAWKDPRYRETLTAAERAQVPEHPAGPIELSESELENAAGGVDVKKKKPKPSVTMFCQSLLDLTKYSCCQLLCTGSKNCTKHVGCPVAKPA